MEKFGLFQQELHYSESEVLKKYCWVTTKFQALVHISSNVNSIQPKLIAFCCYQLSFFVHTLLTSILVEINGSYIKPVFQPHSLS